MSAEPRFFCTATYPVKILEAVNYTCLPADLPGAWNYNWPLAGARQAGRPCTTAMALPQWTGWRSRGDLWIASPVKHQPGSSLESRPVHAA